MGIPTVATSGTVHAPASACFILRINESGRKRVNVAHLFGGTLHAPGSACFIMCISVSARK